jgi:hypothetical protein
VNRLKVNVKPLSWLVLVLALLAVSLPVAAQDDDVDEELAALTEQARVDLAAKLEIAVDEVEVVSARRVTWRNSSCGCPKEGERYIQMLTRGALILLQSGDEEYRYHSSMAGPPFHCEDPAPNDPLPDDSAA